MCTVPVIEIDFAFDLLFAGNSKPQEADSQLLKATKAF